MGTTDTYPVEEGIQEASCLTGHFPQNTEIILFDVQQIKQAWQVLEWGSPDRAHMQNICPLQMEAGTGSLKDYENMAQGWTCGVE